MFERVLLLSLLWLHVVLAGSAFFWQGSPESYPLAGVRGLLNVWISGPLFIYLVFYSTLLTFPKGMVPSALLFGGGVLMALGACMMLYLANSPGLSFSLLGGFCWREGHRIQQAQQPKTGRLE